MILTSLGPRREWCIVPSVHLHGWKGSRLRIFGRSRRSDAVSNWGRLASVEPRLQVARYSLVGSLVCGLALVGCQPASEPPAGRAPKVVAKGDPETALFENYRTGLYQVAAGVASLQTALQSCQELAKKAKGDQKEALLDVSDMLDSAGATLADATAPAPTKEEFLKDFKGFDEERLKAVEKAVDAYRETRNALGISEQLEEAATGDKAPFTALSTHIEESLETLESVIQSFGGKVPAEDEEPAP